MTSLLIITRISVIFLEGSSAIPRYCFCAHYHKDTSNIPWGCICNTYLLLLLPTIIRIQVIFQEGATALYLFFQKRKNANHVFSPKNTSMKNKVLISIVQTKAIKTKKAILNGEGKNHVVKLLDLCLPLRWKSQNGLGGFKFFLQKRGDWTVHIC